jgi:hypothetical protein
VTGLPWVYSPRPGEEITVTRDTDGRCAVVISSRAASLSVRILAAEIPSVSAGIAAAVHEAAGLPAPVILERPEGIDAALGRPDGIFSAGSYAFTVHDGRIDMTGPVHCMLAEEAEFVAAALAVCAAVVRTAEPDPAEVGELTAFLREAGAGLVTVSVDDIARAALRWMNGRRQRGEDAGAVRR